MPMSPGWRAAGCSAAVMVAPWAPACRRWRPIVQLIEGAPRRRRRDRPHHRQPQGDRLHAAAHGCLELVSSANRVVRLTNKLLSKIRIPRVSGAGILPPKTCLMLPPQRRQTGNTGSRGHDPGLALALGNIAAITDPKCSLVGGGVAPAGDMLLVLLSRHCTGQRLPLLP